MYMYMHKSNYTLANMCCSSGDVQYFNLSASNQKSQLLSPAVPCRNLQREYMPLLVERREEGGWGGSGESGEAVYNCMKLCI